VAVGAPVGLLEALLAPLGTALRIPTAVGWDGLAGAAIGLLASAPLALSGRVRARGVPTATGWIIGAVAFPVLAAAFGLLANRVLLSGAHFLSRISLLADLAALVAAAIGAWTIGRFVARRSRSRTTAPGVRTAAALLVGLVLLTLLPRAVLHRSPPDESRPTIILVSIDTLRPDRLSCAGFPDATSPNLDRLCREGLQFSEALAVSPGSAASHAALLTGRYPVSSGVWANFSVMDPEVETLAEFLRSEGYRTGGFATNTFLGKRFGFDQGFDSYVESGLVERLDEPSPSVLWRSLALVQIVDRLRVRLMPGYDPSFETALRWIRETKGPAFFFVHLMDVHSPYAPPSPWGPRFGADPSGGRAEARPRNRFGWRPSEEAYTAEVRFADEKIGRLRRTLERANRLDEGILLLTSDHGENLLDHEPNFSHGRTLFDSTLRILAAIRAPRTALRRGVEPTVLENVDLLPTLAALRDEEPLVDWEGMSFHPRAPVRENPTVGQLGHDFAVRTPRGKLVMRQDGGREFYLLEIDPGERRTASIDPGERRTLEKFLDTWIARHATDLYEDRARSIDADELSPELRAKLRALGYVE
jgi:arylsulfatase